MRKILLVGLVLIAVALMLHWPVERPCVECGETALIEPLVKLAFPCADIVHYECLK